MNKIVAGVLVLVAVAVGIFFTKERLFKFFFLPRTTPQTEMSLTPVVTSVPVKTQDKKGVEVVAQGLTIPWEIVFLPGGDMLVTERPGKLLRVGQETKIIKEIEGVKHVGEGGLLGMALHPKFKTNNFLYLYFTYQEDGKYKNRVERYTLTADTLSDKKVVIEGILGSSNHDGGRIAFGPDGYLYITTGDAEKTNLAQDTNSLNGKILRIKDDGTIPADNPFGNAVYSYGHRNPQGLAWDKDGNLWATEHGPSGSQTGNDEVNLIKKGQNYGWPTIKGTQTKEGMTTPVIESGRADTWAPAGMTHLNGNLYFAGLRGSALYKAKIENGKLILSQHFKNEFGRLRAVALGPDGYIYITTSNRDGRGTIKDGDDKIIKINPDSLD